MSGNFNRELGRIGEPMRKALDKPHSDVLDDQQRGGEIFRQPRQNRVDGQRTAGRGADGNGFQIQRHGGDHAGLRFSGNHGLFSPLRPPLDHLHFRHQFYRLD